MDLNNPSAGNERTKYSHPLFSASRTASRCVFGSYFEPETPPILEGEVAAKENLVVRLLSLAVFSTMSFAWLKLGLISAGKKMMSPYIPASLSIRGPVPPNRSGGGGFSIGLGS